MNYFLRYEELKEFGIPYTRVHLGRLMRVGQFPPALQLSANRIAWKKDAIEKWISTRPAARAIAVTKMPKRNRVSLED